MNPKTALTADNIKTWLKDNTDFKPDSYGNFKTSNIFEGKEKFYRLKFQKNSLRFELQICHSATQYSSASKEWIAISSDYYKNIRFSYDKENPDIIKGLIIGKKIIKKSL